MDTDRIPEIVSRLERELDQFLTACEGMSGNAMCAALDSHPALRRPFDVVPPYALLIEVGTPIAPDSGIDVEAMLQHALMACLDDAAPLLSDVIVGRGEGFWAVRHAITDGLKSLGTVIGLDVAVRRDRLPALRSALLALTARDYPAVHVCDFGHVADGGMHFNIVVPHGTTVSPEDTTSLRTAMFDVVVDGFGGSFSAEHGVGPSNVDAYARYRSDTDRALIAGVELLADPAQLFGGAVRKPARGSRIEIG